MASVDRQAVRPTGALTLTMNEVTSGSLSRRVSLSTLGLVIGPTELSMPSPPAPREFNQTERHTARLRDLVERYPKGIGIIKEFLQNADDAGATFLHVVFDRREHPGPMDNVEQNVVLGPALLLANDRTFTDGDLENIQHIGHGGKVREAGGTGRFGYGFNTSFSITDHPTLLTGNTVIWFDPHQRAHGSQRNAWAWWLEEVHQHWPTWEATFAPAGHIPGSRHFNGTIFRLPARTPEQAALSEISKEPFSEHDFERILQEARQAGPALLAFLRSVQALYIDEIMPDGAHRKRFYLTTTNSQEVEAARRKLRDAVHGDPRKLLREWLASTVALPVAVYRHECQLFADGQQKAQTWMIVTGLFRGSENRLLEMARDICDQNEKALPWAGAAAAIDTQEFARGLACFLPLHDQGNWPLLLHGWFSLDSGRRGIIRQTDSSEIARVRAGWNMALLRDGVGAASAMLLEEMRGDVCATPEPYRLWLQPSRALDGYDNALVDGFYANLGTRPVFRCVSPQGYTWKTLTETEHICWNLGSNWHNALRDPLIADGFTLFEPPLPNSVMNALQKTPYPAHMLSADKLRSILRAMRNEHTKSWTLGEAPLMSLRRRDWIVELARFCAHDGLENLKDLPLALHADGRIYPFVATDSIYLVNEVERALLAGIPHRILDSAFEEALKLSTAIPLLGIKKLDIASIVVCVNEVLATRPLDEGWLVDLFDYLEQLPLANVKRDKESIRSLRIVPDEQGRRWEMGYSNTPVLLNRTPQQVKLAMQRLGVPLISGSDKLIASIASFAARHQGFVWSLSPDHFASALVSHVKKPWMRIDAFADRAILTVVLDYMIPLDWLARGDERMDALRRVPMLPIADGAVTSAETTNLYIPGGFEPPRGLGIQQKLLDVGSHGQWKALFQALGIKELDGFVFTLDLLRIFPHSSHDVQVGMLLWLRSNLRDMEKGLSRERWQNLLNKLQATAIVPLQGGGLGAPRDIYRPDAKDALEVLGDVARIPDVALLGDDSKQWGHFYIDLEMNSTPLPNHLIEAIRRCSVAFNSGANENMRDRLKLLMEYVNRNWDNLGNSQKGASKRFVEALATMAWLPVATPSEKVARMQNWPNRLYKADELAAPALRHLVASVRPVLDGSIFSTEMAKALGVVTEVPLDDVLRHFATVRSSSADDVTPDACKNAVLAFLVHIGSLAEAKKHQWGPRLAAVSQERCVFIRGAWWAPRHVFLESLPFESDWCVSLREEHDFASRSGVAEGLTRLGARTKPSSLDWVKMLCEQHAKSVGRSLSQSELEQVRGALHQLRIEDRAWLQSQSVYVPTKDGHLRLARETLQPDDVRLKQFAPMCSLPLVEKTEISLDIARSAGARSLWRVLVDKLSDEPIPSRSYDALEWAANQVRTLRAPGFYNALRRLAWHDATTQGEDPATRANDENLRLATCLTLRIAEKLRITSFFPDTNEIVFEQHTKSFWDRKAAILWLSEGGRRQMNDALARTLAQECNLDALRLSRLLDEKPEHMMALLDEDNIAVIPEGVEGAMPPRWVEPEPQATIPIPTDIDDDEQPLDFMTEVSTGDVEAPIGKPHVSPNALSSETENASLPFNSNNGNIDSGQRSGFRQFFAGGGDHGAFAWPPRPPTVPGFGSSDPWSPDAPPRAADGTRRLRTYAHREEQDDYDATLRDRLRTDRFDQAALNRVIEWERDHKRTPVAAPEGQRGYDLESSGPEGTRYIGVCGIAGAWTARGVGLAGAKLRKAQELGASWWLYVVEFADDPNHAVVHPICNPLLDVTEYRFDCGWRPFAAEEMQPNDPTEGEAVILDDGCVATIIEAEPRGRLWSVTLQFSDGREEQRAWDPTWRRS